MKYYCRSPLSLFVTIMRCLNKDISTHKHRPSRKIDNLVSMPLLPLKESCCALQKMGGAEVISLCHLTGSAVDQTADLYKPPPIDCEPDRPISITCVLSNPLLYIRRLLFGLTRRARIRYPVSRLIFLTLPGLSIPVRCVISCLPCFLVSCLSYRSLPISFSDLPSIA
jgi:hypothetical protein